MITSRTRISWWILTCSNWMNCEMKINSFSLILPQRTLKFRSCRIITSRFQTQIQTNQVPIVANHIILTRCGQYKLRSLKDYKEAIEVSSIPRYMWMNKRKRAQIVRKMSRVLGISRRPSNNEYDAKCKVLLKMTHNSNNLKRWTDMNNDSKG